MLATPNTATLSVSRTFMSVPSRDFTVSSEPSTASMVPRMRTVGGCWAHAADPSTDMTVSAASARGSNEDILSIAISSPCFVNQKQNTAARGLFLDNTTVRGRSARCLRLYCLVIPGWSEGPDPESQDFPMRQLRI